MVSFQGELRGQRSRLYLFSYSLHSIYYPAAVTMTLISWYFVHWWPCLPYVNGECSSVCNISSLSKSGIESPTFVWERSVPQSTCFLVTLLQLGLLLEGMEKLTRQSATTNSIPWTLWQRNKSNPLEDSALKIIRGERLRHCP